jgi:hypothetical protein
VRRRRATSGARLARAGAVAQPVDEERDHALAVLDPHARQVSDLLGGRVHARRGEDGLRRFEQGVTGLAEAELGARLLIA